VEKRYQVFIGSTYSDLKEERRYVMQALMEMDCIPAGMELFPAADEEQWKFIKKIINECDYYLLIIGGRYGSTSADGISYTEKEYDYAVEKGLKIICLIHKNPDAIPVGKTEKDPEMQKKLISFCEKAKKGRLVRFWEKAEELQMLAVSGLNYAIRNYPSVGFVRADLVPDENSSSEILKLRNRIIELEKQIESISNNAPVGSEQFAQGDDLFDIRYSFKSSPRDEWFDSLNRKNNEAISKYSWNDIFSSLAPLMVNEASEDKLEKQLNDLIRDSNYDYLSKKKQFSDEKISNFSISDKDFQTIKIQLKSLGLISKTSKNRSVRDTATYWTLTPYGDMVMTRLIAIKRNI
jgi:hypothetical protein